MTARSTKVIVVIWVALGVVLCTGCLLAFGLSAKRLFKTEKAGELTSKGQLVRQCDAAVLSTTYCWCSCGLSACTRVRYELNLVDDSANKMNYTDPCHCNRYEQFKSVERCLLVNGQLSVYKMNQFWKVMDCTLVAIGVPIGSAFLAVCGHVATYMIYNRP